MTRTLLLCNLVYGFARPGSIVSCDNFYQTVDNIIAISSQYDYCFIVNDCHTLIDEEFEHMPPHCLDSTQDAMELEWLVKRLKSNYIQLLKKTTFSAIDKFHNKSLILETRPNDILVTGFCTSMDVAYTCQDLLEYSKIIVYSDCTSDLNLESKRAGLSYISDIGCVVI